ncbi:hypothetical protein A4X13_0g9635, partial [Tilletia indica]
YRSALIEQQSGGLLIQPKAMPGLALATHRAERLTPQSAAALRCTEDQVTAGIDLALTTAPRRRDADDRGRLDWRRRRRHYLDDGAGPLIDSSLWLLSHPAINRPGKASYGSGQPGGAIFG